MGGGPIDFDDSEIIEFDEEPEPDPEVPDWWPTCYNCGGIPPAGPDGQPNMSGWEETEFGYRCPVMAENEREFEEREKARGSESGAAVVETKEKVDGVMAKEVLEVKRRKRKRRKVARKKRK